MKLYGRCYWCYFGKINLRFWKMGLIIFLYFKWFKSELNFDFEYKLLIGCFLIMLLFVDLGDYVRLKLVIFSCWWFLGFRNCLMFLLVCFVNVYIWFYLYSNMVIYFFLLVNICFFFYLEIGRIGKKIKYMFLFFCKF